ncbi:MAG: YraN family protein [Peptococcaceae bacterium]|nr:YraN family protein [Peptococcaceae bacterium]
MTKERQELGRTGENIAAEYLVDAGCNIVERNYRCFRGEIDIVARDGEELVFVEVRTRHAESRVGTAEESVTHLKRERLRALAACYVREKSYERWPRVRFDVVAITLSVNDVDMNWIKGAF